MVDGLVLRRHVVGDVGGGVGRKLHELPPGFVGHDLRDRERVDRGLPVLLRLVRALAEIPYRRALGRLQNVELEVASAGRLLDVLSYEAQLLVRGVDVQPVCDRRRNAYEVVLPGPELRRPGSAEREAVLVREGALHRQVDRLRHRRVYEMHDALALLPPLERRRIHDGHRGRCPHLGEPFRRLRERLRDAHRRNLGVVRPRHVPAPRHRRGGEDVRVRGSDAREPRDEGSVGGLLGEPREPEARLLRVVVVRVRPSVPSRPHAPVAVYIHHLRVLRRIAEAVDLGRGDRQHEAALVVRVVEGVERMWRREGEPGLARRAERRVDIVREDNSVGAHRTLAARAVLDEDEGLRTILGREVAPERVDNPPRRTLHEERVLVVRVEADRVRIVLVVHGRRDAVVRLHDSARQRRRTRRKLERPDSAERAHPHGVVGDAVGRAGHLHQVVVGVEQEPALKREVRLRAAADPAEVVAYLVGRELGGPCRNTVYRHSSRGRFGRASEGRGPGADRERKVVRERGDRQLLGGRRDGLRVRVHLRRTRAVRLGSAERKRDVRPLPGLERNAGEVRPRLHETRLVRDDERRLLGGSAEAEGHRRALLVPEQRGDKPAGPLRGEYAARRGARPESEREAAGRVDIQLVARQQSAGVGRVVEVERGCGAAGHVSVRALLRRDHYRLHVAHVRPLRPVALHDARNPQLAGHLTLPDAP